MSDMARVVALISIGLTLASPSRQAVSQPSMPAPAATAAEIITKFGLVGTWREDCAAPPGEQNPQAGFTAQSDGSASAEYRASIQHPTNPIDNVRVDEAGALHIRYVHRNTPLNDALRRLHGIDSAAVKSDSVTEGVLTINSNGELLQTELSVYFTAGGHVVFNIKEGYLLYPLTGQRLGRPPALHKCSD
jgi:hypothetical protein